MYKKEDKDPYEDKVKLALELYQNSVLDVSAGYNLLRYAEKGLLKMAGEEFNQDLELYRTIPETSANSAYRILRMAQEGFLSYTAQT
jgi:hypothetical protein